MLRLLVTTALLALATGCYPFVWDLTDRGSEGSTDIEPSGLDDTGSRDSGITIGDPDDRDSDGFDSDEDCDDENSAVNPDADETCNDIDDDCDGDVDGDAVDQVEWYIDSDNDGFGEAGSAPVWACEEPAGLYTDNGAGDCNDVEPSVYPGADETCDALDNDCDGDVDEDPVGGTTWWQDSDADGYGDPAISEIACTQPESGMVGNDGDCDDTDATVHPGAYEFCDRIDTDCDGVEAPFCKNVDAGGDFSCVNPDGGGAYCGGQDDTNQLNINPFDYDFSQVSAGWGTGCGIQNTDEVVCWGSDTHGIESQLPDLAMGQICVADDFACGRERPSGNTVCWGNGAPSALPSYGPSQQVACSGNFACANIDGEVFCDDPSGFLLGDGPPNSDYTMIDTGWNFACGLRADGTIDCWGSDTDNQLSDKPSGTFVQITTGYYHACALDSGGLTTCWGRNANGQLAIVPNLYEEIDAGQSHTCALMDRDDPINSVVCWGSFSYYDGLLGP